MNLRIAILAVVAACSAAETRVQLDLQVAPGLELESVQVRVGSRNAIAAPHPTLELVIPDEMAGTETDLEVWGLSAGRQVAYGASTITPVLHDLVTANIVLAPVTCEALCELGSVACTSESGVDGTITCEQQEDGCAGWSELVACPADTPYCSGGECGAECSDECTAGATACDTAFTVRACGQYDLDTCLDWSPSTACESGQTCADGACITPSPCANAGDACNDGNGCTEQDHCTSPGVCAGEPVVCDAPPPPTCKSSRTKRTFSGAGTCSSNECAYDYVDTPCPYGCYEGACLSGKLAAPDDASCALTSQGEIRCWGATAALGTPPTGVFKQIDGGYRHACGIRADNTVACWGENTKGQATAPSGTYKQVSAGTTHSCGVRTDGTVHCWGEIGKEVLTEPAGTYLHVSVGDSYACAIRDDRTLTCWGTNAPTKTGFFSSIDVGSFNQGCGVHTDGTLDCWGLGEVPSGQYSATSVGLGFACARKYDHTLVCFGSDLFGETMPPAGTFVSVACGPLHACGMRPSGAVECWGSNSNGQTTVPTL